MQTDRHVIRLQSGGWWDFDDPWQSRFTIEDIPHNLAKEPRYSGATDGDIAYSVAQHEVNASYIVDPRYAFEALHHDDAEFAYKDVTTWLKRLLPDYQALLKIGEDRLADFWNITRDHIPEVKLADMQMLKLEKSVLFRNHATDSAGGYNFISDIDITNLEHLVDLIPWPARYAKQRWLERNEELERLRHEN